MPLHIMPYYFVTKCCSSTAKPLHSPVQLRRLFCEPLPALTLAFTGCQPTHLRNTHKDVILHRAFDKLPAGTVHGYYSSKMRCEQALML